MKAVPESGYLKELRAVFYDDEERKDDTDPVARFAEHYDAVTTERITYVFPLSSGLLAPLIRMTPLTWGAVRKRLKKR